MKVSRQRMKTAIIPEFMCLSTAEPAQPMCFLRAKPIGVMPMLDQGEQDDKVQLDVSEG